MKMAAAFGGTTQKCKACEKTVYFVDQLTADNRVYHKSCFRCHHCKGTLKVDAIMNEAFKIVNADEGKSMNEEEFKKTMMEILGCIMLQLEGNPIFVSSNSVVNEPLASSSSVLSPPLKDSDLSLKA